MTLNPFDLRGPEFLLFYLCFSIAVIGLVVFLRRNREIFPLPRFADDALVNDPYAIAFLRGGRGHMVSVTVMSLLDRHLLRTFDATKLQTVGAQQAVELVRRPIEQAVLQKCLIASEMAGLMGDHNVQLACEHTQRMLEMNGLFPDAEARSARTWMLLAGVAALVGVSAIKIMVALQRGHHNIVFLILLTTAAAIIVSKVIQVKRTVSGDQALKQLQDRFTSLRRRASHLRLGGDSNELALAAAIYGFSALPSPVQNTLRPLHVSDATGSGGGGCGGGSSCGGGGGCGGGGCGGGCGGCG